MRAVHFARFAQQCRLTASDAAALCMLADRAFTADTIDDLLENIEQ